MFNISLYFFNLYIRCKKFKNTKKKEFKITKKELKIITINEGWIWEIEKATKRDKWQQLDVTYSLSVVQKHFEVWTTSYGGPKFCLRQTWLMFQFSPSLNFACCVLKTGKTYLRELFCFRCSEAHLESSWHWAFSSFFGSFY